MGCEQGDLFGEYTNIEKYLGSRDTTFSPVIPLNSTYRNGKVNLCGILFSKEINGEYVHVAQIETFIPKQRNLRIYFHIEEDSSRVIIRGFSFGKTTHRDQKQGKKYSIDGIQMEGVLNEIIEAKFLKIKKRAVEGYQELVNTKKKEISRIIYCGNCGIEYNGSNCSICGYNNESGIVEELYPETFSISPELEEEVNKRAARIKKITCGLEYMEALSSIDISSDSGEFHFRNVPIILGGKEVRRRLKIEKRGRFLSFFINPGKWQEIKYIEPKQTYGRLYKSIQNLMDNKREV